MADALPFIVQQVIPRQMFPVGIGMFFQQKMMTQTSDPTQAKIMYLMPGLFIFMFWSFPSGLVLYWLTNSIVTMIEQTIVMRESKGEPVHGRN